MENQEQQQNKSEQENENKSNDNQDTSGGNKPKRDEKGRLLPGNTANLAGRPKGIGLNLTSLLKSKLEEIPEGKKEAYKEIFIKKLLHKALVEGDLQSMKLIMNYVDGLPKQTIEGTMNNLNIDYNHLTDEELKTRIGKYIGGIGEENETEGDN